MGFREKNSCYHLRGLKNFFVGNKKNLSISLIGIFLKSVSILGVSKLIQMILDYIVDPSNDDIIFLIATAGACFFCIVMSALIEYKFWTSFRSKALFQYREYAYNRILSKSIIAFDEEPTSTYISALSNDLNQIKDNLIEAIPWVFELSVNFCGSVFLMLMYDVRLALIAFGISLLPIIASYFRIKQVEECEEQLSIANSNFTGILSEVLHGFPTIKNFKSEKDVSLLLEKKNKISAVAYSDREHIEISVAYIASISGYVAQVGVLFAGIILSIHTQSLSVGIIAVFVQLMKNIIELAIRLPELLAGIRASLKLIEKLDKSLKINQYEMKHKNITCDDSIILKEVKAYYEKGKDVINIPRLELGAHKIYAIVGESGSGKSTLLNLISGIHRKYDGEIKYDGQDIKDISEENIFNLVSIIHQDVFIFDATIEDNITMFKHYPDHIIKDAIMKSGLVSLIKEKGDDYLCGEKGNKLSGGEKQRIAIARSIVRGSQVLLFDEPTSALDPLTADQIMTTIKSMTDKTRVVVTHNMQICQRKDFDKVFSVREGTVYVE